MAFNVISLEDMYEALNEDKLKSILKEFECEDKPQLKEFYESNGFVCFGKRNLERDEREKNAGEYLLQMLCFLGD